MPQEIPIIKKRVANWLGNPKRILLQLWVSVWSFVFLPTAKYRNSAVYEYFSELYNGKPETLIFDGKDGRYLEQIEMVYNIENLKSRNILDLGCGDGAVFNWLLRQNINPESYRGIDFAHPDKIFNKNARIIKNNVNSIDFDEFKTLTITAVNILVYLNPNIAKLILKSRTQDTELIIIDPIPGLFWDAYWDNVQLFYRKPSMIIEMLKSEGWHIKGISIDYGIKFMNSFFFPLSYCLFAEFSALSKGKKDSISHMPNL